MQENSMDALLAKLTEQQHGDSKKLVEGEIIVVNAKDQESKAGSSSSSAVLTPASDVPGNSETQAKEDDTIKIGKLEMLRLKKELEAAKKQLELQKQELDRNRVINHTLDQAIGHSTDDVGAGKGSGGQNTRAKSQQQQPSVATSRLGNTHPDLDTFSDTSDPLSTANYNHGIQNIWPTTRPALNLSPVHQQYQQPMTIWGPAGAGPVAGPIAAGARPWTPKTMGQGTQPAPIFHPQPMPQQRIFSGPPSPGTIGDGRFVNEFNQYQPGFGVRRATVQNTRNDTFGSQQRNNINGWSVPGSGIGGLESMNIGMNPSNAMGIYQPGMPYQPRPIGTPLSPTAAEFRADQPPANPWNTAVSLMPCWLSRSRQRSLTT